MSSVILSISETSIVDSEGPEPTETNPDMMQRGAISLQRPRQNNTTIEVIDSDEGHVESSQADITHETALEEIRTAILNNPPPFDGV